MKLAEKNDHRGLAEEKRTRLNKGMEPANAAMPALRTVPVTPDAAYFRDLLLAVARRKDKEAFATLFEHFAPRIKSFLMKGGAAPDIADEMAQETMITIWQRAETFDPSKASASTWIFTIARNKRIDALRRQPMPDMNGGEADLIVDSDPLASESIAQQEEADAMADAIKNLPSEQADLLYKSFFEDKTHADIAKETNLPLGTVKSRIRIALDKLRSDKKVKELWI